MTKELSLDKPGTSGDLLLRHANLATLTPDESGADAWGLIEDAALVVRAGRIAWFGPDSALPSDWAQPLAAAPEINLGGACVLPGLIDCHTHLVYAGDRAHEFEQRLNGVSYEAIARAGGGIRSTMQATRAADENTLLALAQGRVTAWQREGVTTLEVKSGYGLSQADEAKCLRVARRLGAGGDMSVLTAYLGAHALPPEYAGDRDAYITAVCQWMSALHAEGLIDAVDAFCETIAFSPAQVARVFAAAQALGLPIKLHAEQLSDQGGATLAAQHGALSCDHLEYLSDDGARAMAQAGTVAVLLPCAWYFLRETQPMPIERLQAHGVAIALASDHNPGSSPSLSLLTAVHMACTFWRMTPLQAILGVTRHAATALGQSDRGHIAHGLRADLAAWALNHPRELAYWLHPPAASARVVAGRWLPVA